MVWALKEAPVPNDPVAHLVLIAYADHAQDDGGARPATPDTWSEAMIVSGRESGMPPRQAAGVPASSS
jgi:hypothetical protein